MLFKARVWLAFDQPGDELLCVDDVVRMFLKHLPWHKLNSLFLDQG